MEFWRELAAVLEDFLFNEVYACVYITYYVHNIILVSYFFLVFLNSHRPDGVQLIAEQLREHEAIYRHKGSSHLVNFVLQIF